MRYEISIRRGKILTLAPCLCAGLEVTQKEQNKKTKTIGVIIPDLNHHFFALIVNGIEFVARKNGYNVIVALSNESFEKEVVNMQTLADSLIDGFILSLSKETLKKQDYYHINESINQGMPVVLFDRVVGEINCDKVIVDDFKGAYDATKLLIDKGRENILLLTTEDYINVETGDYITNITKAKNILNWKPEIDFEEGIGMTVDYYTKHISKYL